MYYHITNIKSNVDHFSHIQFHLYIFILFYFNFLNILNYFIWDFENWGEIDCVLILDGVIIWAFFIGVIEENTN